MIRQLGKPTFFLTMSANEVRWPMPLNMLHRLKNGTSENLPDPLDLSASQRAQLVNEDPMTCCIYFWKKMQTIMKLLQSKRYSPFGEYIVNDYFMPTESQHRGSPHLHILLWLQNDPKETVSEIMPKTVALIEKLCSVDMTRDLQDPRYIQT